MAAVDYLLKKLCDRMVEYDDKFATLLCEHFSETFKIDAGLKVVVKFLPRKEK